MQSEEERTFNEAMNEWAAKQSFLHNSKNRLIHPDPSLPLPFRLLGYGLRLAFFGAIFFLAGLFLLKKYVGSKGFADMMSEKIGALIDAESYEGSRYRWKGARASTKLFSAQGSEQAFFKELEATGIAFEMPKNLLFNKTWDLEKLEVGQLDVTLRVGQATGLSAAAPAAERAPLTAGFGINPDLERLRFAHLQVKEAAFRWGVTKTNQGSVTGSGLVVTPPEAEAGAWTLDFAGGRLRQNWWRDLQIDSLRVEVGDGRIAFKDSALRLGSGTGSLRGDITLGAIPDVSLQLNLQEVPVTSLIPAEFGTYLAGTANASIGIEGSPNTRAGFGSRSIVEFANEGTLLNIPAFEAISRLLDTIRFRVLPLTGGTVTFETGERRWNVSKVDIQCGNFAQLRGAFTVSEADRKRPVAPISALAPASPPSSATVSELERWEFSGELSLGIDEATFPRLSQPEAAQFFTSDGRGTSWIAITIDGTVDELTNDLADQIIAAANKLE